MQPKEPAAGLKQQARSELLAGLKLSPKSIPTYFAYAQTGSSLFEKVTVVIGLRNCRYSTDSFAQHWSLLSIPARAAIVSTVTAQNVSSSAGCRLSGLLSAQSGAPAAAGLVKRCACTDSSWLGHHRAGRWRCKENARCPECFIEKVVL